MIALTIPSSEIKNLMNRLLKEDLFDFFELRDVSIRSFVQFDVHGLLSNDDSEETENADKRRKYALWRDIRPYVFNIIKGAKRPQSIKFVFSVPYEKMKELTPLASVLFLNVTFENGEILITTGLTKKEFSLDKGVEHLWDDYIRQFFRDGQIAVIDL